MNWHMRSAAALIGLLLLTILSGCDEKKVTITGKLIKDGRPMVVDRDYYVTIVFIPDGTDPNQQTHAAKFKRATGNYEIELTPGKYRINYVIVEKGRTWPVPAEQKERIYDCTKNQELDIEVN